MAGRGSAARTIFRQFTATACSKGKWTSHTSTTRAGKCAFSNFACSATRTGRIPHTSPYPLHFPLRITRAKATCGADENILRAELASPVSPGEKSVITVGWRLTLANVDHRTGVAQHAVNLGNFYPVLCVYEDGAFYECEYYSDGDPFYSECADYSVTFTAPAGYTLAASGQIVSADADGANKIYEMRLENARDFAVVLSEEFSVAQCEAGGVQLMYY